MWFQAAKDCRLFYQPTGLDTSKPVVIFLNGTAQTTLSRVAKTSFCRRAVRTQLKVVWAVPFKKMTTGLEVSKPVGW